METREQLQDELTIQQVLLTSIEGGADDGVEEERRLRRMEIAKLKERLEQARQGIFTPNTEDARRPSSHGTESNEPQDFRHGSQRPTAGRSPAQGSQYGTPTRPSYTRPDPMTPGGSNPRSGSWSTPLPSRKRDVGSARLDVSNGGNKSRRTTPTPQRGGRGSDAPWSSSNPGSQAIDYIDLTNDDDIDADLVAAHASAEQRLEQVRADRQYAVQLSQSSSSPTPTPHVLPSQNNAFNRMMVTQQRNSQAPRPSSWGSPDYVQGVQQSPMSDALSQLRVPGAYDPSWNQPSNGYVVSNGFTGAQYFGVPPSSIPSGLAQPQGVSQGYNMTPAEISQTFGFEHTPSLSGYGPPIGSQRPGGGFSLASVINRTNGYDFANQVDERGNSLPEGLTNYLNDVYHDTRMDEKEIDNLLNNIRPDMDIPTQARHGTPDGLKGTLYHHQELALTWLKNMEDGTNKGGILADDMGLGKTISMLSLLLSRPANARPKTNLIIGPLSLMKQWEEEIMTKVKPSHRLSVFIFHGNKKNNMTTNDLLKYDVVLTTYMTLAAEHKRLEKLFRDTHENGRQVDFRDRAVQTRVPLLHPQAKFYRVILDEAQCIKNRKTQSANATHALKAKYRWCLSGTPMMNSVEELFSLIAFLHIKPYCNWDRFKQAFGTLIGKKGVAATVAMNRLRTVLTAIMLRRKKDSMLDGKPILRLPPKTEQVVHVQFSTDEHDFYNQLNKKSQVIFNKYLREGTVGKNYSNLLVLLLRLRQACCHPHLNLDVDDAGFSSDQAMLDVVKTLDSSIVTRIKEMESFECPICYDVVQSPSFFVPCGHDSCKQCLAQIVDSSATRSLQAGIDPSGRHTARCPVCRGEFDPSKCFTHEAFLRVHDPQKLEAEATEGIKDEDVDNEDDSDSSDGWSEDDDNDDEVDNRGNLRGFIVQDDDWKSEDESKADVKPEEVSDMKQRKSKLKSKGKGRAKDRASDVKPSMLKSLRKEAAKNRQAYKQYMSYLRKTWLPSAKATKCIDLLKEIHIAGEKTIVFSQWTLLLDLIEVAMRHEGFEHKPVRYDGSMSAKDRNDAAVQFRSSKTANVILVSLKAGNAGLNLAAASRVIILDPFWNPYIEMQAVDRAYRIGQQREVRVYRILTMDTVEDRIIELQEKKKEMIEMAMDEGEGRKISRLTTTELKYLFTGYR